ncbi:sigma 54-interacting transcriptional regulator [Desulfosporosinus sp. PR]|uniref:sigma-54 interaction domain-containing protein n=1 Tax=Candidatus Desulfosporosinus nitrosoreducens TaxID=3401928 RepID=UPI0027F08344|nr:sigma 54-interacting transcriptional regulator [Desulfosporosinus sp. PR]MDQ7095282.1 sigma 54-interacting transcriptional regulator [Desulfosporosinus sp. PR]
MDKFSQRPDVGKLHEGILDVLSDGIYVSDAKGKTLAVNHMYEQLTGLKKEEITGKLVTDLRNQGNFDVVLNPEVVKTGQKQTSVQVTKEGRRVILNACPVFDESGKVALVVTFVRDITLLTQLKDQIANQQEIIDKFREVQIRNKTKMQKGTVIFASKEINELINLLEKVAKTDATVLLLGETGVGKDVFSKLIHERSLRHNEPFFKVDCSTIPENLIESELFGYEAGAFSGANTKGKPGLLEMADKGTLFLDEIGELPLLMQSKLLRALQDQEIIRVGSTKVRKFNVRFIAATNRNLEEEVKSGRFRSDLFYRLRVAVLQIPPLRERREDILALTSYFFEKYNTKYRKDVTYTQEVCKAFQNYRWPGNVREMDNFIQSLIVTRDKEVLNASDLPPYMHFDAIEMDRLSLNNETKSLDELMADYEKKLLKQALDTYGSIAKVAKFFRVDRTTIFRKAKKYSLLE